LESLEDTPLQQAVMLSLDKVEGAGLSVALAPGGQFSSAIPLKAFEDKVVGFLVAAGGLRSYMAVQVFAGSATAGPGGVVDIKAGNGTTSGGGVIIDHERGGAALRAGAAAGRARARARVAHWALGER
jgi:hypothetical protein